MESNDSKINIFLEYFRKEWVESSNNCWYKGIFYRVPSTNNGQEANNGGVKKSDTCRERAPLNQYFPKCKTMIKRGSEDRTMNVYPFHEELKFKSKLWIYSFNFLKAKLLICKISGYDNGYIVTESKNKETKKFFMRFNDIWALNLNFNSAAT